MRFFLTLLIFVWPLLLKANPIDLGLAGAGVAKRSSDPTLLISNPASLSGASNVFIGGMGSLNYKERQPKQGIEEDYSYTFYAADKDPELMFPAALFYTRGKLANGENFNNFYLSTQAHYAQKLTVGGGGYVLSSDMFKELTYDFKLGLIYDFNEKLGAGFVWDGFLNQRHLIRTGLRANIIEKITMFFDFSTTGNEDRLISLAVENLISDFVLRVGANSLINEPLSKESIHFSAGLGWLGPKINFNYGVNINKLTHEVDLTVHF